MNRDFLSWLEDWDGDGVVVRRDRPTKTWIFIALHSSVDGRAAGGTRMKVYSTPSEGLVDALRLAEGMTYKWAGLELPYGGGKAVLAIPRPLEDDEIEGLLERYGAFIESLRGAFVTGADLGAGPDKMEILSRHTRHVLGLCPDGSMRDPGPYTAYGVECGMRAAIAAVFEGDGFENRTILIQGVGDVGAPLARSLAAGGAKLLLSDVAGDRAQELAAEIGAETVPAESVYDTVCDVFAPCAVGAVLNPGTIPRLRCRIVAGSANNQLLGDDDAERLHRRGILYVPDYILNAGGALVFALMREGVYDVEELRRRVERIAAMVSALLERAGDEGSSPLEATRRQVERRLAEPLAVPSET